jgi:colanic acid biosynthesis glycosyl transferase WcaI
MCRPCPVKILIYCINFAPELTGIGKYTGEMTAWLAARGHEVRVVTAPPYYPDWKVGAGYSGSSWRREHWKGAEVWRCPLWVPARPGGIKRVLHLASFALSSLPVMLRQLLWLPDAVWVVEPPLFCAPTAWAVARLSGARAWLHISDYEVDAAFDLGLLRGKALKRMVLAGEHWLMRRFDVVSTISQRMLERALSKGVDAQRLVAFPNWVDVGAFISANGQAYRDELGIPADAVVALYSGNMGRKQGLEIMAQVAQSCAQERQGSDRLWFVFCGNGVGRMDLLAQCEGIPNVRFLDLQPAARLPDLLAMADIHLMPQRAGAADLVMPSKLTGMLASARPVVATALAGTELANVVQLCGIVVPPEDPAGMTRAVLELAGNAPWRAQLGQAGRQHALHQIDRESVLQRFEKNLSSPHPGAIEQA